MSEEQERPLTRRELRERRQLADRAEAAAQATAASLPPFRDDDAPATSEGAADTSADAGDSRGSSQAVQPPTRRSRREQTQTSMSASTAGEHIADTTSSPSVAPDAAISRETPRPGPSSPPSRRSMRDVQSPTTPGRGERMPATGLGEGAGREGTGQGEAAPSTSSVRPPARAQGVRRLESTGELSAVRSTRAREDSLVEVTGPIDWSSSMIPAVTEDTPAPESTGSSGGAGTGERPRRVSVLAGGDGSPTWGGVTGSAGAAMPRRAPEVAGAASRPPLKPEEIVKDAAASIEAEDAAAPRRPRWVVPLAIAGLILLGVALGTGAYFLFLE